MKNSNILRKISQGMYVLTTNGGGCIVDSVSQVSGGDNALIAVSVMKKNYTNELLNKNNKFALSVLGNDVNPEIIKTFGFNSSRDINKFENIEVDNIESLNIIKDSLGYMIHKDELLKVTTEKGKTAWVCIVCGYVYYGEEIPEDFKCPICGVDKSKFKKKE